MSQSLAQPAAPDVQLARQARAGCADSFGQLTEQLRPRLIALLRQRVGRWDLAEDLAQDAIVRAWEKLDRYDAEQRFSTWLFTIGIRLAIDHHRTSKPTAELKLAGSDERTPDETLADDERRENLWATADRVLNESQRTALWLRYHEQMDVKQIAGVMRKTPVSVRVTLMRARQKLAPHVAQWHDGADEHGGV